MKRVLAIAICLIILSGCAAKDTNIDQGQPITIVSAIPQDVTMPPAINIDTPKVDTKGVRIFGGEIPKPFGYPKGENPLFDEDKVLVLPIEGARHAVYDCYGNRVAECSAVSNGFGANSGLHNKNSILDSQFSLMTLTPSYFIEDDVAIALEPTEQLWFSTDLRNGDMAVYDIYGTLMFTVKATNPIEVNESRLIKVGENFLLCSKRSPSYTEGDMDDKYALIPTLFTATGELVYSFEEENIAWLGNKFGDYFMAYVGDNTTCIFDQHGTVVKRFDFADADKVSNAYGVYVINDDYTQRYVTTGGDTEIIHYYSDDSETLIFLDKELRSFGQEIFDQIIYGDASLSSNIPQGSIHTRRGWVTVEPEGNALKVKTDDKTVSIEKKFDDEILDDMNECYALLRSDSNSTYRLIYLPTGEEKGLFTEDYDNTDGYIGFSFKLTDNRACCQRAEYSTTQAEKYSYQIFGSDGTVGYQTDINQLAPLTDELMILIRGPYLGIADYSGNWVIKQPRPELARDTETSYGFEYEFYLFYNSYNNTNYNGDD